ncbi:MAG: PEP-CTERM sorting domain-containing protein [Planctomycetota bacterium]
MDYLPLHDLLNPFHFLPHTTMLHRSIFACALFAAVCFLPTHSVHADMYLGNGNSGFGGVLGTGSLELTQGTGADSTKIFGNFARGGGNFNDALIIYIDSETGGFSNTSSFNDTADELRSGVSGFDGTDRSTVNFAAGFEADYAIGMKVFGGSSTDFAGLFDLDSSSHGFVTSVGTGGLDAQSNSNFTFEFDLADIGLGLTDDFRFVATYLNSTNAFRSDEAIGAGIGPGNPGNGGSVTFTNSLLFSSVPEPTTALTFGACLVGIGFRRRRGN